MKVLFVSSGNSKNFDVAPFIRIQAESIKMRGINLDYYTVKGKGFFGYIKYGFRLRNYLKKSDCNLIHVHYSLSGWSAVLGSIGKNIPIVLSLMGTDTYGNYIGEGRITPISRINILLTFLIQPFVKKIISKSRNIERAVYLKHKSVIIPNGVDLKKFYPVINRENIRRNLRLDGGKKYVLFLGNKQSKRKNFSLVLNALPNLNEEDFDLVNPYPIHHTYIPNYLNAADVVILTSYSEGSPNIIKEAMACNCPIVSTDVGDVRWLFGDEPGHFITSFEPEDVAEKIKLALKFSAEKGHTNGRQRIIDLGLDSETVAKRIIKVYEEVLADSK